MSSKNLDNLVSANKLKHEDFDQGEFVGLIKSGEARLNDAKINSLSQESRFDLAYNAAHALSLAALRFYGYRPANSRYIVFQVLPHTLKMKANRGGGICFRCRHAIIIFYISNKAYKVSFDVIRLSHNKR